jgi:pimeloyl-[acyl-carrier protein] methyl ester esterase
MTNHLVLLPGLDGTGQLFADFLAALPDTFASVVVAYPPNQFLSYRDLTQIVRSAAPKVEPFVLLSESFSTPVALEYAASNPSNLRAVILSSGFVFNPLGHWSALAKAIVRPWLFKRRAPRLILEHFLVGDDAPAALIEQFRHALSFVSPEVLSRRVRESLNCDARDALARTAVPLVYVQAMQDKLLVDSCVSEMKRIKPDILIEKVAGPHLLLQREPQKVAEIVSTFVQQIES